MAEPFFLISPAASPLRDAVVWKLLLIYPTQVKAKASIDLAKSKAVDRPLPSGKGKSVPRIQSAGTGSRQVSSVQRFMLLF